MVMVGVSMTVPAMHEQMQHGAQEEQDIRECTEDMRPVSVIRKNAATARNASRTNPLEHHTQPRFWDGSLVVIGFSSGVPVAI